MSQTAAQRTWFGHPAGLAPLFFAELWERFSYYGMRALLTLYMVAPLAAGGLDMPTGKAALIYGTYTMSVYMLSIAGGTIADNILGSRRAVLVGGIVIAAGHFAMAIPSQTTFFAGLLLIVLGTGLLKPNISAMVGQLYTPGDARRDAGFSLFYMGINVGAFIAPFITGFLAQHSRFKEILIGWGLDPAHSWHWGFGAAGVGMVLGVIVFIAFGQTLKQVGSPPDRSPDAIRKSLIVLIGTLGLWGIAWLSDQENFKGFSFTWIRYLFILVPIGVMIWFGLSAKPETRKLGAIFYFFIGAFIFWALFEQAGTSLNLFADRHTVKFIGGLEVPNSWFPFWRIFETPDLSLALLPATRHVGGIEVPSSWYQAANPIFVVLLAPVFAFLWIKLGDRQPSSPMKFTIALVFLALAFSVMVPAAKLAMQGRVSPLWLMGLYFLQTIGEMCLSPVGLSTFTKLAPRHLVGAMLGIWFLGAAFGNKFAGVLASAFGEGDASNLSSFFGQQSIAVLIVAGVFLALVPVIRRWMGGVR